MFGKERQMASKDRDVKSRDFANRDVPHSSKRDKTDALKIIK